MKDNVIIPNKQELDRKIEVMKNEGVNSLQVISDFDRTLTNAFFNGEKISGILSHLDHGNYLKGYAEKAQAIFNKYHPIEISSDIKYEEKRKIMLKWWIEVYELLIKCGLNETVIKQAVKDIKEDGKVRLREGCKSFLENLQRSNIPIIIMSATGIGNMVTEFLRENKINYPNIHFIGNTLEFNKENKFLGIKDDKIIHILNKHEAEIKNLPVYGEIINRRNVILIGDSLGDLGMAQGINPKNIIKMGFYNLHEESLEEFKQNFDIVITNDGSFEPVNEILRKIIE